MQISAFQCVLDSMRNFSIYIQAKWIFTRLWQSSAKRIFFDSWVYRYHEQHQTFANYLRGRPEGWFIFCFIKGEFHFLIVDLIFAERKLNVILKNPLHKNSSLHRKKLPQQTWIGWMIRKILCWEFCPKSSRELLIIMKTFEDGDKCRQ